MPVISPLVAQIQTVSFNQVITTPEFPQHDSLAFDVNNDNTDDFAIIGTGMDSLSVRTITFRGFSGTRIQTDGTGNYAWRFFVDDVMDSGMYLPADSIAFLYAQGSVTHSAFAGAGEVYAALSFRFDDSTHYGWMRIFAAPDGDTLLLDEVGWEETAGKNLLAGQEFAVGVASVSSSSVSLRQPSPGEVALTNLSGFNDYVLFSATGEMVSSGKVSGPDLRITGKNPGIHFVQLRGNRPPVCLRFVFW